MSVRDISHHATIQFTCDVCGTRSGESMKVSGWQEPPPGWKREINIGHVCSDPACHKRVEEFRKEHAEWNARRNLVEKEANRLRNQHVQNWAVENPEPKVKR